MTSTGATDRHDRAWGRWTARPKPSVCSSQAGTTTPAVPRGGVASPPDSPPFIGCFVLTQRRPLVRLSGGPVGARGAKNALMSHVGPARSGAVDRSRPPRAVPHGDDSPHTYGTVRHGASARALK